MPQEKHALVAFGGNMPFGGHKPHENLLLALDWLHQAGLAVRAKSGLYATPCFPAGAGPDYVNAAAVLDVPADLDAAGVLARLHAAEAAFGRERSVRWGGRSLDADLIALGDAVLPDAGTQTHWRTLPPAQQAAEAPATLILPHPRLQDRAFVLVPLADVAPDWCHPILRQTVRQMLAALPAADRDAVKPL